MGSGWQAINEQVDVVAMGPNGARATTDVVEAAGL